jgi:allantoin racemase
LTRQQVGSKLRILVINPNTNPKNTKVIADAITPYLTDQLNVDVVSPEKGPVGLESYYHNYLASVQVHKRIVEAEKEGYDGVVVACYGDPGVEAAKEIVKIPVVGITEASYALARILCTKFLVVVSAETAVPRQIRYIKTLGIPDYQYAVRPIGLTVLGVMSDRMSAKELIAKNCEIALKETGAEFIVMGCSGFSGLRGALEEELKVPIIDPVVAGIHICQTLIQMKIAQSKVSTYKTPPVFQIKE